MAGAQHNSTRETVGAVLYGLPLVFLGMEMVPGWGFMHLDWSQSTYLIVVGLAARGSAAILAARPVLGFVCGGIGALTSLGVLLVVLQHVDVMHKLLFGLVLLAGGAPAFGLYVLLDRVLRNENPPPSE